MGRPHKFLSREDVERAMRNTKSNRAAARFCRCSYTHYKTYASSYIDPETGKTLYELHKNSSGKGIPKFAVSPHAKARGKREPAILDVIEGRVPLEHYNPQKIKYRLIEAGYIKPKCSRCGFKEKRLVDGKSPLILIHKDGDKANFRLDNLKFLCYNCAFLEGGVDSPVTEEMVEKAEDCLDRNNRPDKKVFELDDYQKEFLRNLGKTMDDDDEEYKPGSEYISRL